MNHGPSLIELSWTAISFTLLVISIWQWRIAVGDYEAKREQARYRNGDAHAGMKLAHFLAWTILLDCVILGAWTLAGSLSVFRHYLESVENLPGEYILFLLFLAVLSFGARVVLRAITRVYVNRL